MKNYDLLVSILKDQVVPALGCTEPMAVAYAVAKGKEIIEEEVKEVTIGVDKNIFKNGKEVGIPGTDKKGIIVAAALSIIVGNSDYKLQVLKDLTNNDIEKALKLIDKNMIHLNLKEGMNELYIEVLVKGENNSSKVVIRNSHLNVVLLEKNGKCIAQKSTGKVAKIELKNKIKEFKISEFKDFVDNVEYDKISFINEGIVMNKKMAQDGLDNNLGIGLGKLLYKNKENLVEYAKAITAAACEARMSGHPLPVMSSAGSGNHGLVAIIPIAAIGERLNIDKDKIVRSVALSHLVTIYIKSYTGALSPVCGCGVAAGVGASAGLTYLLGGNINKIQGAIKNMIAGISGMICDGAKIGCAYKLCVSVSSAIDASKMALDNVFIPSNDGILDDSPEKSIQNLGKVSTDGMSCTDDVILNVMMNKCS